MMNEYFDSSKVTIGVDGVQCSLSKKLVCNSSTFFDRAFNGNFKEGDEQKMELKDAKKKTFDLVLQWMLTGHVVLPKGCDRSAEYHSPHHSLRKIIETTSQIQNGAIRRNRNRCFSRGRA
jgi:hypothetical protein